MASSQLVISCEKTGKVTNYCRVCGTSSSYQMSIFNGEGPEHDLATKINKYLPIQVCETDTFPLTICCQCASSLISWHQLVIGCIKADEMFKKQTVAHLHDAELEHKKVVGNEAELEVNKSKDKELVCPADVAGNVQDSVKLEGQTQELNSNERCDLIHQSKLVASHLNYSTITSGRNVSNSSESNATENMIDPLCDQTETISLKWKFQCTTCSHQFSRKSDLKKHNKTFHLTSCDKEANSSNDKETDNEDNSDAGLLDTKKDNSKLKTFHCEECGKNFTIKDSYFRHVRIHTGEKPFTCVVCGKPFRDSGGLARHLKVVHGGIKNFSCDICNRSFASKATQEDHRRTHTGERPYVCDSCGKTFKSKASLYIHSKIHTDLFPHPCTHCDRRFRRRQEMVNHIMTHTGEKPYVCDVCGKSFRVYSELRRHKSIHSEEKPFTCNVCGINFRLKRYLRNHEKMRHSNSCWNYNLNNLCIMQQVKSEYMEKT